eukprot:2134878-Pyramimonas_sp.AAC.1
MYNEYPSVIEEAFGGDPTTFWNGVRPDDPRLASLGEMTSRPDWKQQAIPLVLHGDGAPFTKKDERNLIVVNLK